MNTVPKIKFSLMNVNKYVERTHLFTFICSQKFHFCPV